MLKPALSANPTPMRVLMITTGWPIPGRDNTAHFIKRQADFLRAAGVTVEVLHFVGRHRPMNYVRGWLRAQSMLVRRRYDLVHAQWGQSALVALPTRLPLVVTYRGGDLHGLKDSTGRQRPVGRLLQRLCVMIARRADAVILVSGHMKQFLTGEQIKRMEVIPSGLDCDLFRPIPRDEARRRLGLAMDARLVLFAGDPECARKRYSIAQAAVELLKATLPVEMVIGWGVPHEDMPYYMNACDAMVFTSSQEGSPNVVKEALACNLPVVSVPVGDVAERIAGIEGCELCQDERPETIAEALGRTLRRGARVASRDSVLPLAEEVLAQKVISIYRSVLGAESQSSIAAPAQGVRTCST